MLPLGLACFSTMIRPRWVLVKRTVITSPASRSMVAVVSPMLKLASPPMVLPLSVSPLTIWILVRSQPASASS